MRLLMMNLLFAMITGLSAAGFYDDPNASVWYAVMMSASSGITWFSMYMLPPLVFSWTLADEWESKAVYFWISRTGVCRYAMSKYLGAAAGGFLCVFGGYVIMIMVSRLFCPLFVHQVSTNPYDFMMAEGKVLSGFLLFITDVSLSGSITAVFGMLVSSYVTSPFTAIAAPLITYLAISRIVSGVKLPRIFDPLFWMHYYTDSVEPSDALVKKAEICIPVIIVMIIIGIGRMRRRIQND